MAAGAGAAALPHMDASITPFGDVPAPATSNVDQEPRVPRVGLDELPLDGVRVALVSEEHARPTGREGVAQVRVLVRL
mgnify:CR=1 FL=1